MDQLGADRDADERDLTVYGLLGFQDPLRPEVPARWPSASAPAFASR